ncbi:hypothetical protein F4556_002790 [Kitasatospora gansuensis]|uniref:Nucleic acid/nucleotide deaminase of polymorphic system toxin n=1 Tax=Kitasatospora gansuensis TaxID=258050 RepID=A0A7W7SB66_9ACTN|nr:SUKH-4 family immunity protein [Kitasatospora gansuensis]MBB4947255.1 hypothetical protein [Kitasatospora gansuensis]
MVTYAQAQELAEDWINAGVPRSQQREVRVREFDLGFVCWAEPRTDAPSADPGSAPGPRLVIARDSGASTLWPALPVNEVVSRYETAYGSPVEPNPAGAAKPVQGAVEATSFLLSPPQWLKDAGEAAIAAEHARLGEPGSGDGPTLTKTTLPEPGAADTPAPFTVAAPQPTQPALPAPGAPDGPSAPPAMLTTPPASGRPAGDAPTMLAPPPTPPAGPPSGSPYAPTLLAAEGVPGLHGLPGGPVPPPPAPPVGPPGAPLPPPPGHPAAPPPPPPVELRGPATPPPAPPVAGRAPSAPPPPPPAELRSPLAQPATPVPGSVPVPGAPPVGYGYPDAASLGAPAPAVPPAPMPAPVAPPVNPGVPSIGPGSSAVVRYRGPDGSEQTLIQRSEPGTPHPEWKALQELRRLNVPPDQVLELHTDLECCDLPGGYCLRMVRAAWPNVRLSHTAPYGRDQQARQAGMAVLLDHVDQLHQLAAAPQRPRPVRAPMPQSATLSGVPVPLPPAAPQQLAAELGQVFGPSVFRFEQRAVSRQGVPEPVAQTLMWAGLPRDFAPFFWAQAQEGRPIPTLAELAAERGLPAGPDFGGYLVLGNDYGRQLCVQYGTAAVVAVDLENGGEAPRFVNTGVPEFVRSLALLGRMWRLRYGLTPDQAGRWTTDFQAQLLAVDPAALQSPETWWSVLLEQFWDGLF